MEFNPPNVPEDSTDAEAALSPTVVGHCSTLNEAQMVVSLLASFGIEATIDSENYYRMLGSMVPGLNGIRVRVRQLDAEAALEILSEGHELPDTEQ
jgi:hypothetical protein